MKGITKLLLISTILVVIFSISSLAATVTLDGTNAGVEQDYNFDEDGTPLTNRMDIACMNGTTGAVGYVRWNLSLIPAGSTITNVTWNVLRSAGETGDWVDIYRWNNSTWTDSGVATLCGAGANPYCDAVTNTMETYVMSFKTKSGWHAIFDSNLTNSVNTAFGLGATDYTFVVNYSDGCVAGIDDIQYGNLDYIAGQTYNLTIEYTPAAGGSSDGYWTFNYPYYSFKISNTTGALINLTATGETTPILKNASWFNYNSSGLGFTKANIELNVYKNTTLYDIIIVNYDLEYNSAKVGYCNETFEIFENDNKIYWQEACYAYGQPLYLYRNNFLAYPNGVSYSNRLTNAATWTSTAFSGSGTYLQNVSVRTGRGGGSHVGDYTYILGVNNSNGWIEVAAHRFMSGTDCGWNECGKAVSATYFKADTNDSLEHYDEVTDDYRAAYPNMSLLTYDDATNPYLKLDMTFDGLAGYTPPTGSSYVLEVPPVASDVDVARDRMRNSVVLIVGNTTVDQKTEGEAFHDGVTGTQGEVSFIGSRFFWGIGQVYDQNHGLGAADSVFGWQSGNDLKRDMNFESDEGKQMLLSHCYESLRERAEGNGWWQYFDPRSSQLYSGQTFFGNAYNRMLSCYQVLYSPWMSSYTDVIQDIRNEVINSTAMIRLNEAPNDDTSTIIMTVNDNMLEVNLSAKEINPLFRYTGSIGNAWGGFMIGTIDLTGSGNISVNEISCNATDGTVLWFDNMTTDNSSSYNITGFTYQAASDRFYCDSTCTMEPKGATHSWVNYTCAFTIQVLTTADHPTIDDYTRILLRGNSTLSSGTWTSHSYYYMFTHRTRSTNALLPSPGDTTYFRHTTRDISKGIWENNWYLSANDSAWLPITNPVQVTQTPDHSDQIFNQFLYYVASAADSLREAEKGSNITYISRFQEVINNTVVGFNYLFTSYPSNIRQDGYLCYSRGNCNHDSGYLTDSVQELSKLIRSADLKVMDLPHIAYYIRHGRGNTTCPYACSPSTEFSRYNALFCAADTRACQFTWNQAGYTADIGSDNYHVVWFMEDMADLPGFENSNCSMEFDGKIGNYYPDNHVTINTTIAYSRKVCDVIRVSSVSNAMVQDSWQTNATTNISIEISPIPYPSHDWYLYAYMLGDPDNESYPKGIISGTSATYWDTVKDRWYNNVTKASSFSFVVNESSNVSIKVIDGNASSYYNISRDGIFIQQLQTDSLGFSNYSTIAANDGSTITLTLASAPAVPNNSTINLTFIYPTDVNGTIIYKDYFLTNVSINTTNLTKVSINQNFYNLTLFDENTMLYMNFNNNAEIGESLTLFKDISIYKNDGTASDENQIQIGPGVQGNALKLNGSNIVGYSPYIDIPDNDDYDFSNKSFTISVWVKVDGPTAGSDYPKVIIKKKISTPYAGYLIYYSEAANSFRFTIYDLTNTSILNQGPTVTMGEWNHIVANYNTTHINLYWNGLLYDSDPATNLWNTDSVLRIGANAGGGSAAQINGSIDELIIWNRSLSQREILQLYQTYMVKESNTSYFLYVNNSDMDTEVYDTQVIARSEDKERIINNTIIFRKSIDVDIYNSVVNKTIDFYYGIQDQEAWKYILNTTFLQDQHKGTNADYQRIWIQDYSDVTKGILRTEPFPRTACEYNFSNLNLVVNFTLSIGQIPYVTLRKNPYCFFGSLKTEHDLPLEYADNFSNYSATIVEYYYDICTNGTWTNCGNFSNWKWEVWNEVYRGGNAYYNYSVYFNKTIVAIKNRVPTATVGSAGTFIDRFNNTDGFFLNISNSSNYPDFFGYHIYDNATYYDPINPWYIGKNFNDFIARTKLVYYDMPNDGIATIKKYADIPAFNFEYNMASQFSPRTVPWQNDSAESTLWMASALAWQVRSNLSGENYFVGTSLWNRSNWFGLWLDNGTIFEKYYIKAAFPEMFNRGKTILKSSTSNDLVEVLSTEENLIIMNKFNFTVDLNLTMTDTAVSLINNSNGTVITKSGSTFFLTLPAYGVTMFNYSASPASSSSSSTSVAQNPNAQAICGFGYTSYVLLGILTFVIIIGFIIGILAMPDNMMEIVIIFLISMASVLMLLFVAFIVTANFCAI